MQTMTQPVSKTFRNFQPKGEGLRSVAADDDFKSLFERKFDQHKLVRNPYKYEIDYSVSEIETENIIGMIDYRSKKYSMRRVADMGGVKVSLKKILAGIDISEKMGIPVQIFFSFQDTPRGNYHRFLMTKENFDRCGTGFMNYKSEKGAQEIEPVVVIPVEVLDDRCLF